jgi:trimeric autotransporter adhesin
MNPSLQCKPIILPLFIAGALACFGLLPKALAVVPPPDGGYPGFNTAEGQKALFSLTTGQGNTAVGWFTLESLTTGNFNTAIGAAALVLSTADENTATGAGALLSNIGGSSNTATGAFALFNNVGLGAPSKPTGVFFGSFNTANGDRALFSNTNGDSNTAAGAGALTENTTGGANTAVGISALSQNTTADDNTAVGAVALFDNTTGTQNTAVGFSALHDNSTGNENTATGNGALQNNTEGHDNTANGLDALFSNTTGNFNTAVGESTLASNSTGVDNTAIGDSALSNATTGSSNTALGAGAGANVATASNVISIGVSGEDVSNTAWIGNVYSVTTQNAMTAPVIVSADGQLGTIASSERFKKEIANMGEASDAILSLRPVTFHYKTDIKSTPQFGLIAEEVAKVNPALVLPDKEGKPYTVRYDQVNAMLLNEFLKEHKKVEEQQATITQLKKDFGVTIAQLTARLDEQAAQIQKVSAQLAAASPSGGGLEASKPAPQVVNNP